MQQNKKSETPSGYRGRHVPIIPIFFNEPPDLTGWCEGVPGVGRIVAIKSVIFSDGSAKRYYKVEATKNPTEKKAHEPKRKRAAAGRH